jgi:hypothetical protein
MSTCTLCGKPITTGGAKGLCARHYAQRRRGKTPETTRTKNDDGDARGLLCIKVDALERHIITKAAGMTGESVSEWVRGAIHGRALRDESVRLQGQELAVVQSLINHAIDHAPLGTGKRKGRR